MYGAIRNAHGDWRVIIRVNGEERDLCGATNSAVAWKQVDILNEMRRAERPRAAN